jgi:hypothetical protein
LFFIFKEKRQAVNVFDKFVETISKSSKKEYPLLCLIIQVEKRIFPLSNIENGVLEIVMENKEFRNITSDELRQYMLDHQEEDYQLIDVRQPKEYSQGHIAGAHLLPLGELTARLSELPVDRDIIFY